MRYDIWEDQFPVRHVNFAASPCHVSNCHFLRGTMTWQDRNLAAPFWRLYWNPTGNAEILYKQQRIVLDKKTIALIPPEIPFSKSATTFVEHFNVHFTANPDLDRSLGGVLHRIDATPVAVSAMREIIGMLRDNRASTMLFHMMLANLISWGLLEVSRRFPEAQLQDRRLNDALNHINEHYSQQIENASLARIAGMNRHAFVRFFKGAMGQTPQRYILRKRIDLATMLLGGGDLSIDQIAEKAGFCDRNYFTTVFTKEMKISPAAYRRRAG